MGLELATAKLVGGFSALCFLIGTLPAIYLIEKVGRRNLLLAGSIGTTFCMTVFTILLAVGNGEAAPGWGAVAMVLLFEL